MTHACRVCGAPGPEHYCRLHRPSKRGPSSRRTGTRAWRRIRLEILARDHHVCRYCGDTAVEVDHLIPVSAGGTDHPDNLVASCRPCNRRRGDRPHPPLERPA